MNIIQQPAAKGNYGVGRNRPISRITFHYIYGDAPAAINRFQTPGVEVSATYVIGSDGQIYQMVKESDTPYSDGDFTSNSMTISIEHAGGNGVPYTDAMYKASIELVCDLINRYGITDFKRHRDIISTLCPGELDVERIISGAQGDEDMPSTVGDVEINYLYWPLQGYNPSNDDLKAWSGTESNTFIRSLHDNGRFTEWKAQVDAAFAAQNELEQERKGYDAFVKSAQAVADALGVPHAHDGVDMSAVLSAAKAKPAAANGGYTPEDRTTDQETNSLLKKILNKITGTNK
jgi:hypothetical protein